MEYRKEGYAASLGKDGTRDTLIIVRKEDTPFVREVRFDCEYAANFRNQKTGAMTRKGFQDLASEAIESIIEEASYEGGN